MWKALSIVDLTAYADASGYINVHALTCAALTGAWQEGASGSQLGTAAGTMASQISTTSVLPGPKGLSMK